MRNYDVYLPVRYNDGAIIPQATLGQIRDGIVQKFGGATVLALSSGSWHHCGETHSEDIRILRVICEDNEGSKKFFEELKEQLEEQLKQTEIFIVTWEVETVNRRFPNSVEKFNRHC